nr:uncharacterized protein LOC129491858 [Symphalangus syndactylus]
MVQDPSDYITMENRKINQNLGKTANVCYCPSHVNVNFFGFPLLMVLEAGAGNQFRWAHMEVFEGLPVAEALRENPFLVCSSSASSSAVQQRRMRRSWVSATLRLR